MPPTHLPVRTEDRNLIVRRRRYPLGAHTARQLPYLAQMWIRNVDRAADHRNDQFAGRGDRCHLVLKAVGGHPVTAGQLIHGQVASGRSDDIATAGWRRESGDRLTLQEEEIVRVALGIPYAQPVDGTDEYPGTCHGEAGYRPTDVPLASQCPGLRVTQLDPSLREAHSDGISACCRGDGGDPVRPAEPELSRGVTPYLERADRDIPLLALAKRDRSHRGLGHADLQEAR